MDGNDVTNIREDGDVSALDNTQALRTPAPISRTESRDFSGTILGGYRLVRKMAEGGMGVIYEAVQLNLSRKVALKILNEELAVQGEFLHRFEREAKAAAALNHPNVVQVHDFGETQGWRYLIMEYVEGQDLSEYTEQNGKLSTLAALEIIEQAAQALKAAAEKSIIHRDIKPSNLLLTREGQVKVLDLGLAKIMTEASDLTMSGIGMGSPYFMAPEQATDASRVDHRADIYSLGLTLLFLLTGKRPYDGETPYSLVLAHATKPLPRGLELGTELPGEVEALIRRMSAKEPEGRYASYDLLIADVRRVKAGYAPVFKAPRLKRNPFTYKLSWIAAGLAVGLGVAGAVWWSRSHRPTVATANNESAPQLTEVREPLREPPEDRLRGPGDGFGPPRDDDFDERRGPPPRGREGRIPFPIPPLPRPDFSPLDDGPVDSMLAQADQYAQKNPQNFRNMIDRYRQVLDKARGTPQAEAINRKIDDIVDRHQAAVQQTISDFESKMNAQLRAGKAQEAYDVWKDFPAYARTRESDQQIQQLLDRAFPAGFTPGK